MKAVHILDDPAKIRLLANFTRAEILQLLYKRPMTEAQLSKELGLTRAAVGYHLHILMKAQLIYLEKVEAEEHGILQKFYSPVAALIIVDYDRIPEDVKRYFIQLQIMHMRGVLIALHLKNNLKNVSPTILEELSIALLKQLKEVGRKYLNKEVENAEALKVLVYAEALKNLIKKYAKGFI